MGLRSSHPSDLAEAVFYELQRRYHDRRKRGGVCPSLEGLTNLFESMYFASLGTEEGEHIVFHVVYLDPADPDPDRPMISPAYRWTGVRFATSIPATIPNLVKIAMASDPSTSSLALYHDADGRLFVWGLVDQGNRYHDYITHATPRGGERPGLFQASIIGIGRVAAFIGYEHIAELRVNTILSVPHDVLADGPIRDILQPGIQAYIDSIRSKLPEGVYEQRADRDARLTGHWLSSLSHLLLRVQDLRRGGAILITADTSRQGLDIKYEIQYVRLRTALQEGPLLRIRELHAYDTINEQYLERNADTIPRDLYLEQVTYHQHFEENQDERDGTISFISLLTRVDGLVLMDNNLEVHGFGVMIGPGQDHSEVYLAGDSRATQSELRRVDPNHYGSRHRSMMRYCADNAGSVGFVISQDGDVRVMTQVHGQVVMWENIRLHRFQYLTR